MKKFITIGLFVILMTAALAGCTQDYPNDIAVYGFDTAYIQYDLSGEETGQVTMYLRGDQKAIHKTVGDDYTLELDLGDKSYIVDVNKATAVEVENADYAKLKGMSEADQEIYLVKKSLGLKDGAEVPESLNKKVIAGEECNVYIIPNIGSACIWDGIVLEKEITIAGMTNTQIAVDVQTNMDMPADRFELPANVIVK